MDDKQFINHFLVVLGVLVGIGVLLIIIASYLHSAHHEPDLAMLHSMEQRLQPVGKAHIGTAPAMVMPAAGTAPAKLETADAMAMDAKTTYDTVCAACHTAGVANAPIYGDKAAWKPRLAAGTEAMYASSINGKGAMPAKGGRIDLSDEAIRNAVNYMLKAVN